MTHDENPQTVPETQEEVLQEGQDSTEVVAEAEADAGCDTAQAEEASADAQA